MLKFSSVVPVNTQQNQTWFHSEIPLNTIFPNTATGEDWLTVEAEDVEKHRSDLVVGTVLVEQDRKQSPHGISHLHPVHV